MAKLEWDDFNIEHLAGHGITPEEVEELFERVVVRLRGGTDRADRHIVLGRTAAGRYLQVIYQRKLHGVLRPFTGRDMRPVERRLYGRQVGE